MEKLAKLPNGEKVVIESIESGMALVRRVEGERRGTYAVCSLASLTLIEINHLV
jgi:hypothetical protein